jgi:hypothetical protein
MGRVTKDEAKSTILELDLKPIESYSQFVQRDYAKVMAEEKKPKRGKRAELKLFDEVVDPTIDELVEIKSEQPIVIEPVVEEITAHEVVIETIENE